MIRWCHFGMMFGWYVVWFFLPFSKAGIEIGACTAIGCWVVKRLLLVKSEGWWRWTEQLEAARWPLIAFVGLSALAVITSVHPELSMKTFWRKSLEYAALFVVTTEIVKDMRHVRWALILLVLGGMVLGADSIVQFVTGKDWLRGYAIMAGRVTGPFVMPSILGSYVITVLPLLAAVALVKQRQVALRLGCVAAGGLLTWALAASLSRGAWFSCVVVGLVLAGIRSRRRFVVVVLGLLVLAWTLPDSLTSHLVKAVTVGDAASRQRVEMWAITWQMIKDRPIFGHGLGVYMWNLGRYGIMPDNVLMLNYAHNCYLQLWSEVGIFGLAAFLWLIWVVLIRGVRRWLASSDPFLRVMVFGAVFGTGALLVHSAIDTDLYALQMASLAWLMLGLTHAVSAIPDEDARVSNQAFTVDSPR